MGSYSPRAVTSEEYKAIINIIRTGYTDPRGVVHAPNEPAAFALVLESNIGARISDILHLHLVDFVFNGDTWQLDIIEQKTGKPRRYIVPEALKQYIDNYCAANGIGPERRMIQLCERSVQKQLKAACEALGLSGISTHSFRRFAGLNIYAASGYDIATVQQFYQHGSACTTMQYIRRSSKQMDEAIKGALNLV